MAVQKCTAILKQGVKKDYLSLNNLIFLRVAALMDPVTVGIREVSSRLSEAQSCS